MVSLGKGQPQAPLTTNAQDDRSRAKGRALGKSRRGAAEVCHGKGLKHQP